MSLIDKLMIEGIRNFGVQAHQVIEFYHPITVIVGSNGSGKTVFSQSSILSLQTIIECLRYISTGELPPGSKGGAFIHDPKVSLFFSMQAYVKIAGETEVQACIRLKMRSVSGQAIVVTRRLQSSQKQKKLEMKTLEGLIQREDPITKQVGIVKYVFDIQKVSLSSKCADLDKEV